MQNYEIALIVNPDMSSDIEGFKKEFEGLLSSLDFNVVNVNGCRETSTGIHYRRS